MIVREGQKWACKSCITGHRSSKCTHEDRELFPIAKKGRPSSQCKTCQEASQTNPGIRVKCTCQSRRRAKQKSTSVSASGPPSIPPGHGDHNHLSPGSLSENSKRRRQSDESLNSIYDSPQAWAGYGTSSNGWHHHPHEGFHSNSNSTSSSTNSSPQSIYAVANDQFAYSAQSHHGYPVAHGYPSSTSSALQAATSTLPAPALPPSHDFPQAYPVHSNGASSNETSRPAVEGYSSSYYPLLPPPAVPPYNLSSTWPTYPHASAAQAQPADSSHVDTPKGGAYQSHNIWSGQGAFYQGYGGEQPSHAENPPAPPPTGENGRTYTYAPPPPHTQGDFADLAKSLYGQPHAGGTWSPPETAKPQWKQGSGAPYASANVTASGLPSPTHAAPAPSTALPAPAPQRWSTAPPFVTASEAASEPAPAQTNSNLTLPAVDMYAQAYPAASVRSSFSLPPLEAKYFPHSHGESTSSAPGANMNLRLPEDRKRKLEPASM